jgi:hypothetical protein
MFKSVALILLAPVGLVILVLAALLHVYRFIVEHLLKSFILIVADIPKQSR